MEPIAVDEGQAIGRRVRPRVGLLRVAEHRHRQRLRALQMVVRQGQPDAVLVAWRAGIGACVQTPDPRGRVIAVSVVANALDGGKEAERAVVPPGCRGDLRAGKRAAGKRCLGPGIAEAVLHVQRDGAAERVETEKRIGPRQQLNRREGVLGNQVPVHNVGERFVDTHPVLEHGKSLRCTQQ